MNYEVRVIGDQDLPDQQDWALMETPRRTILLIKEGALTPDLLAEVWGATRKLRRHDRVVSLPRQAVSMASG